ncbi:MAG: hypothetical protein ACM65M_19200 [Microcoleus sp.]
MTELHAVSGLQHRYELASRQAVYDRLAALKIKPISRGKLSTEQLDKMDALDKWLKANPGGSIADFPRSGEVVGDESSVVSHPIAGSSLSGGAVDKFDNFSETLALIEAIAEHISKTRDPLQHYAALERAIANFSIPK